MNTINTTVAVVLGMFALAAFVGALWATYRRAEAEARIDRLQDERDDYLSRLNYIEPRFKDLEQQVSVLIALKDPNEKLDHILRLVKQISERLRGPA